MLPPTLNVDRPSTHVDWDAGAVALLTEPQPWRANGRPRRAGVSSFGISGTNAHVILEEAPPRAGFTHTPVPPTRPKAAGAGEPAWVLSGRGMGGLRAQAARLREFLAGAPDLDPADVALSLAGRPAFESRAVLVGESPGELLEGLAALADGRMAQSLRTGVAGDGGTAFLFTGQGAQRAGMGRELYDELPVFRAAFDEVCVHLDPHLGCSLKEVVLGEGEPAGEGRERRAGESRERPAGESAGGDASGGDALGGDALGGDALDGTALAQPALFALEVALFRVLEAWGVRPDYLIGHSVGELAAAHVAGVFSLQDACRLVAARGQLMGALPAGGAMVAIVASEEEVIESAKTLADWESRVALAAVNAPGSVVVSGDEDAVSELASVWEQRGRRTKRLRVSHAFHSPRMDAMLEEFGRVATSVSYSEPRIPLISNLSGGRVSGEELCTAGYWVRHVRETVRFADGVAWLLGEGVRSFLELGPDGVLSAIVEECVDDRRRRAQDGAGGGAEAGADAGKGAAPVTAPAAPVVATPVLRSGRPETRSLLTGMAEVWVGGVGVEWDRLFAGAGARRVRLPSYAFQRDRYWLAPPRGAGDVAAAGQAPAGHPLLGAAVALADSEGWLFTGRLSLETHRWLADHAVLDAVVLPGAVFVELALHVGGQLGCESVRELVLEAPLVLDDRPLGGGGVRLQLSVGEPDESGARAIAIHSCSEGAGAGGEPGSAWTRHASGVLAPRGRGVADRAAPGGASDVAAGELAGDAWPPEGAVEVEVGGLYELLAEAGLEYGPVFQGVRGVWRRGEDLFAEVALGEESRGEAELFALHPALLDAALQISALATPAEPDGEGARGGPRLPFAWSGVSLYATGASRLRVRLSPAGGDAVSLRVAGGDGAPVAAVESLTVRPISREQLGGARGGVEDALFDVRWAALAELPATGTPPVAYEDLASLVAALDAGAPAPEAVSIDCAPAGAIEEDAHAVARRALELVQGWLAEERLLGSRLVLLTRGAVAAIEGEDVPGLAQAPVWGLVRTAQTENPGRFLLIDVDGDPSSSEALPAAVALDEPQLAVRAGRVYVPRLAPATLPRAAPAERFEPNRTVLITGGTGALGALVARHLVSAHGVRSVLLASRRGPAAQGAAELEAELGGAGASVRIVACDVGDRAQVESLLEAVPVHHPLGAVVHAAGVLDDCLIGDLTAERMERVMAPKVDAALHLHELTERLELTAFVLFSSSSATLGGAGQGNYAAANAFLDGLAAQRRARGLAGVSLAWGLWEQADGLASQLSDVDRSRIARAGVRALSSARGLELLDAAQGSDRALLVPVSLDRAVLRAQARAGELPPLLHGLVRVPARRASDVASGSLAERLANVPAANQGRVVLELTLRQVATVLGYASPGAIDPQQSFKDLGFDSLAAVELRNRLSVETGLALPATLVFDHPTAEAVAQHLLDEVGIEAPTHPPAKVAGDEDDEDDEDVKSASADEVFALLDRELGLQ